jgi:tetratricopeptide (TPR) repeat protein
MGQARDYEALIRELLDGVAGGWSYGNVIVLLMTKGVDETDLALCLREFAEGLSLERDWELIEQLKLLGKMTPGKLASEAFSIVERLDSSYGQNSEFINYQDLYNLGVSLHSIGRYEDAIINYNLAIEIQSNFYQVLVNKGSALVSLKRYEEAIDSYEQAIKIKPNCQEAWHNRSIPLHYLGQNEESIASNDRAIEIQPDFDLAFYFQGIVLSSLKRYEEAIDCYDRAIDIQPDFYKALRERGIILCDHLGKYEQALDSFDRAIEIKPDNHDDWYNRFAVLQELGREEESFASLDRAIEIKPSFDRAWYSRGTRFHNLEQYQAAVDSFDRTIEINPLFHKAWHNRGLSLNGLEQYKEAIFSFDRAIEIQPLHQTWHSRGLALDNLEQYEEALNSYNQAIEIKQDYRKAWYNKAITLSYLWQYEEAILSFDCAIVLEPGNHDAWFDKAIALREMGKYQAAIVSFDRAIEIKLDHYKAWLEKGTILCDYLGKYGQSLNSFDRSLRIQSDYHITWHNRSVATGNLHGYKEQINAYNEAFQYIHRDTHPEGWGYLQQKIGNRHYQEGKNQLPNYRISHQLYYGLALTHYHNALQTLTREEFPKLRIETLIDTAKVYLAQHNTIDAHQCKTEALDILRDLLNAQSTFAGKKRLQIEFISLSQLDVDLFVASGDNIRALEAAELDKNNRLTWLLSALAEPTISPEYARMQQLLTTTSPAEVTGILYWHLSPDNLTTFILTPAASQPLVRESDRRAQAQELAKWIKEWDTQYRDYSRKKPVATQPSGDGEVAKNGKEDLPWRKNLPDALARLRQILEIDRICAQLPVNLTHLILIPHGDLHRFPIHTCFLNSAKLPNLQGCTYLPSIQIGLNLQHRSAPTRSYTPLLSVEDPETHQAEMPFARIESAIVRALFQPHTHIDSASASLEAVENALRQPHASFHFTGHAAYNSRSPEASALALTDEPLTAKRIAGLDLSSYNLVTLAACETAIAGREKIDTEYVGLTSAFLQAGAANVLSTLWQVDEIANAWFTSYFYQQLLAGKSPAVALTMTQRWMQTLTWQNLADWLTQLSQLTNLDIGIIDRLNARITNTLKEGGTIGLNRPTKYSHPYYWAAFTLTGEG